MKSNQTLVIKMLMFTGNFCLCACMCLNLYACAVAARTLPQRQLLWWWMAGFCAVSAERGTRSKSSLHIEKDGARRSINHFLSQMFSCGLRKSFRGRTFIYRLFMRSGPLLLLSLSSVCISHYIWIRGHEWSLVKMNCTFCLISRPCLDSLLCRFPLAAEAEPAGGRSVLQDWHQQPDGLQLSRHGPGQRWGHELTGSTTFACSAPSESQLGVNVQTSILEKQKNKLSVLCKPWPDNLSSGQRHLYVSVSWRSRPIIEVCLI